MKTDIEYLREQSKKIYELYDLGKEKEALNLLEETTKEAKKINEAYYHFFLGEKAGFINKDNKLRLEYLDKATHLKENDFFLIRNKGVALAFLHRKEEAIKLYDEALKLNPKDYLTFRNKGVVLSDLDKAGEAIKQYDLALEINPKDYISISFKGVALSNLDKVKEAIKQYDLALELNPKDYLTLYYKGIDLSDLGLKKESIILFRSIQDKLPEAKARVAEYEFVKENYKSALKLISEAFTSDPDHEYIKRQYSYIVKYLEKSDEKDISVQKEKKPKEPLMEIRALVKVIRNKMSPQVDEFLKKMEKTEELRNKFLSDETLLDDKRSLFLILRKWNSYTPIIPDDQGERYIGGGYFIFYGGKGTIIDPGYNFIENFFRAGGRIKDIHNIILTHAHNDHTIDFESILSLIYQYNSKNDFKSSSSSFKKINIYMNIGCFKKFSGLLDLRGSDYIDKVYTLTADSEFLIDQNLKITALKAYHDELITKKYSVGIRFDFLDDKKTIILTSDTGLFPHKKKDGETVANHKGEEIWKTYKIDEKQKINLLITHIGSMKENELKADIDTKPEIVYYANHLGIIGTSRVISAIKPKLAIVSEFGEELKDFQEELIEIIDKIVKDIIPDEETRIVPGDTSLIYDIKDEKFYCILNQNFQPIQDINFSLQDQEPLKKFYYYDTTHDKQDKVGTKAVAFEKALNKRKGIYFKK